MFVERVQLLLDANTVAEGKRGCTIKCDGRQDIGSTMDSPSAGGPKENSFKELVDALKSHFEPKPLVIAECFHFHHRSQGPDKSIPDYVAELPGFASKCGFKANLEEALWDQFVCGLQNEAVQKRLLNEQDLQFVRAVDSRCRDQGGSAECKPVART